MNQSNPFKQSEPARISALDLQIAISVVLCLVSAMYIPTIQYMAACFAAILSSQDSAKLSWKTGLTRLILTGVAGLAGIVVVLLDNMIANQWAFLLLVAIGLLGTLFGCKLLKLPYISARIGAVTFILVVMIQTGLDRIDFAVLRLVGTLYGVLVAIAVSYVFKLISKGKKA